MIPFPWLSPHGGYVDIERLNEQAKQRGEKAYRDSIATAVAAKLKEFSHGKLH